MKNKKKEIFIVLSLIIGVSTFLLVNPSSKKMNTAKNEVKEKKDSSSVVTKNENIDPVKPASRKIASVPNIPVQIKKENKRIYLGKVQNLKDLYLANSVNDDWKEKYQKNFFKLIPNNQVKDFKVELKRSVIKVSDNVGKHLEHVLVSFKNQAGKPFSFEAYIDSETGHVVHTWNRTRHEFKQSLNIKGNQYLYHKEE